MIHLRFLSECSKTKYEKKKSIALKKVHLYAVMSVVDMNTIRALMKRCSFEYF